MGTSALVVADKQAATCRTGMCKRELRPQPSFGADQPEVLMRTASSRAALRSHAEAGVTIRKLENRTGQSIGFEAGVAVDQRNYPPGLSVEH